jgi:uncharacterized protein YbcC (UPF0753/DUF2309 family)
MPGEPIAMPHAAEPEAPGSEPPAVTRHADSSDVLRQVIQHAAHLLPAQGPITVFVHHNTLHALEDLSFDGAIKHGATTFNCQTLWPKERYRELLERERIRLTDLSAVLLDDLGDGVDGLISFLGTRYQLRLTMLRFPLLLASAAELRWFVAETDALRHYRPEVPAATRWRSVQETRHWVMRDLRNGEQADEAIEENGSVDGASDKQRSRDALTSLLDSFGRETIEQWDDAKWESFCLHLLWRLCHHGVHGVKPALASVSAAPPVRHRDLLLAATGQDLDQPVHELLIRFCASFLDQGLARWQLPHREAGFFRAFNRLYSAVAGPPDGWLRLLPGELARIDQAGLSPLESIAESLELLGVAESEWERYVSATLLALRGWAGMIWQMETRGDRVAHPAPPGSLIEFLAVRLILERLALARLSEDSLCYQGPLQDLRGKLIDHAAGRDSSQVDQRAFQLFQLAQLQGWMPVDLYRLSRQEWSQLVEEVEAFSGIERRRVFQLAYERRYRVQALDALAAHAPGSAASDSRPSFQVICCIDDREESFRRHLEEVEPACETESAAGFFAVAMYFRGLADAHFVPLCPIVVRPQHWVDEDAVYTFKNAHRRSRQTRRMLGTATHRVHVGSRTFAGGALLTALGGSLASIPLVARVLFPRLTAQIRNLAGELVKPPAVTQLRLERSHPSPGMQGNQVGYSVPEMAGIVERLLRDTGMTRRFARLMIIFGHGSSSLNNPHESAYNCGACAGARGGPNARAFARMANDPRVRDLVARNGLALPADLVFVGAYHNTCDDSVTYFDLDRVPPSHHDDLEHALRAIDEARERNAHERCRRFESAPLNLSADAALRHVEARAEDLAQTRPEYNHATNALCIIGRRSRTRGLFMDRRAFLNSYDPTQDDEQHSILTRILQAAVPVCAGISLEYYFSTVDPVGWGCATKLPHNLTSLLGVMDGASSDLRTGLTSQMIEIHEPMRLLFVIETTPAAMLDIMEHNPAIARLCRNRWVQLATLDPHSQRIDVFQQGQFVPYWPERKSLPQVERSVEWYRGWRDHLGFAVVRGALASFGKKADA